MVSVSVTLMDQCNIVTVAFAVRNQTRVNWLFDYRS